MATKSKIGIIGGGNLYYLSFLKKTKLKSLVTPYGKAFYYLINNSPLILRHGEPKNKPPHKVNYQANIFAFNKLGVKYIFSFNSVGSCKRIIKPGEFLIPNDYINFDILTFYNKECRYITPEISPKLRKVLIKICKKLKFRFKDRGVYFQTKGPRFETKAEINLIKNFADVVGMTMAKEATLVKELDLEYTSLCSIDNYAHGVVKIPLTQEMVEKYELKIKGKIEKIVQEIFKIKSL
ncbi:MTAP family purine nucleoside phosphorylase [Patescibacteria group bacterium]|nr:MTAP family purine nucleoside phosphorylase [Patescibacteria group bacterium]